MRRQDAAYRLPARTTIPSPESTDISPTNGHELRKKIMSRKLRFPFLMKSCVLAGLLFALFAVCTSDVARTCLFLNASNAKSSTSSNAASSPSDGPVLRRFRGNNRLIGYGSSLERSLRPIVKLHDAIWPPPMTFT